MRKEKELGYELLNIVYNNIEEFQELWNKTDFDTKEKIVNGIGDLAYNTVLKETKRDNE